MSTLAAAPPTPLASGYAAPPWRALALLALVVLAAHALVLKSAPERFGPERNLVPKPAKAFVTRSIAPPPPVQPAAPPPVAVPKPRPVAKPAVPRKTPIAAPETPPPETTDTMAASAPRPPASDVAPASPGDADRLLAEAAAPAAAASAASASASAPAGPVQTPVTAMALPASVKLDYKMTGNSKGLTYHANAELRWQNAGDSYNALMRVSALFLGSRTMASTGALGEQGLAPTRFSDKSRSEVAAHFEADKNQISFSANTPTLAWVQGAQDRVSVFLQLGGMLAGNPAGFPVGSTISMYTVGPRDADTWTFLVEAEEKLALPFGEFATIKLTRQPRREFDQKVEIWYAPSLGYLPVRNKITQANGDFVDQQLSALGKD
ncbi:DUF3108 domain-containing protein [Polaromonas sp. YR568]|uniref:DUF3108 domain-containing protein n=1 Tax=Polaromonas sp. YR568 TaxID=1855301 RepID=UPI00398C1E02